MTKTMTCSLILIALLVLGGVLIAGCAQQPAANVTPAEKPKVLIATTTSLYDTGLLNYLESVYENRTSVDLLITSQGTGKAIELAKRGDADVLLVHSPSQEMAFLEGGNGMNRRTFAYNYFIIAGPANDPAGIKGLSPEDGFRKIRTLGMNNTPGVAFISRGDGSGTHSAEQTIWKNAKYTYATDIQKSGNWYVEAGKGMGETLQMASEKGAYTLTDEGTYLAYKGQLNLTPIVTQGSSLLNQYSVMTVYTDKSDPKKIEAANAFVNFLIAPDTLQAISDFGRDKYGKSLFTPMSAGLPKELTTAPDFTTPATAAKPLVVYYAGSLVSPFGKMEKLFEKAHPDVDVIGFSGPSGTLVDKVTRLTMKPDVLASADYTLIQKNMIPANASWYANFAKNSIVLCYNDKSAYAKEITPDTWYTVLAKPDVSFAISDPTTDPAGYRSLMTIQLAEKKYGKSDIFDTLIVPNSRIRATESGGVYTIDVTNTSPDGKKFVIAKSGPDLVPLLTAGTIDYAFEYSSVAIQNNLSYVTLPVEIDLSSAANADGYKTVQVKRAAGTEVATAIVYGITVPTPARNTDMGIEFVKLVISKQGQDLLAADGQTPIVPAEGYGTIPDALKELTTKKS
jgi:tungstate ABC transporter binding protein WtpA